MQPHHHRTLTIIIDTLRPHVHAQAVLAGLAVVPLEHERLLVVFPTCARRLWRDLAVVHRTAYTRPGRSFCRRYEPVCPAHGCAVRNSFERVNLPPELSADLARCGFHHRLRTRRDNYPAAA